MLDVIIFGGRLVDGSGNPWYKADVGIEGGEDCGSRKPGAGEGGA